MSLTGFALRLAPCLEALPVRPLHLQRPEQRFAAGVDPVVAFAILCSRCDRGNRYCSRACWRRTHDAERREAARRYQGSRRGRIAHAARSRRWRQRVAVRGDGGDDDDGATAHNVTHQGSHPVVAAAPLGACTHDTTSHDTVPTSPVDDITAATVPTAARRCCRCAAAQPDWVRQGFLRHPAWATTAWMAPPGRRHDHSP